MNFQDLSEEINQVFEQMYFDPSRTPYRVPVCTANNRFIAELTAACEFQSWVAWTVMGVVGGKRHFILHNCLSVDTVYGPGVVLHGSKNAPRKAQVIVVDFKAKKRVA